MGKGNVQVTSFLSLTPARWLMWLCVILSQWPGWLVVLLTTGFGWGGGLKNADMNCMWLENKKIAMIDNQDIFNRTILKTC